MLGVERVEVCKITNATEKVHSRSLDLLQGQKEVKPPALGTGCKTQINISKPQCLLLCPSEKRCFSSSLEEWSKGATRGSEMSQDLLDDKLGGGRRQKV